MTIFGWVIKYSSGFSSTPILSLLDPASLNIRINILYELKELEIHET